MGSVPIFLNEIMLLLSCKTVSECSLLARSSHDCTQSLTRKFSLVTDYSLSLSYEISVGSQRGSQEIQYTIAGINLSHISEQGAKTIRLVLSQEHSQLAKVIR